MDERVHKQTASQLANLIEQAGTKCEFLIWFETKSTSASIDVSNIGVLSKKPEFADWDISVPFVSQGNPSTEEDEKKQTDRIQQEILQIIGGEETSKQLQNFIE